MTEDEVARRAAPLLARMIARVEEGGPVVANPADVWEASSPPELAASAGFPVPGLSGPPPSRRRPGRHSHP